jgi:hypothetical protein
MEIQSDSEKTEEKKTIISVWTYSLYWHLANDKLCLQLSPKTN